MLFRSANLVLERLKVDSHSYFARPVSEQEYCEYKDIIHVPMDLSKIKSNVDQEKYLYLINPVLMHY